MANNDTDSEEESFDEGSEIQNKQKENDDIEKGNDGDWSTGFSVRFEFILFYYNCMRKHWVFMFILIDIMINLFLV